ncbi:MAG: trehalose-phosphatase [Chloroflexi bacterium]|nr:trehalose-phosphatase [Chloroflexota bacterium]
MPADVFSHLEAVRSALHPRPRALLTDLDGTLAPMAPTPYDVKVTSGCRAALASLRPLFDLVGVVTGRPALLAREMVGIPDLLYIGGHGLERLEEGRVIPAEGTEPYPPLIREALARLQLVLPDPCLTFEDKGLSANIHYRRCADQAAARDAVFRAIAADAVAGRLQAKEARLHIELRPPLPLDKGTAIEALCRQRRLRSVVYIGDDSTDLDAYRGLRTAAEGARVTALLIAVATAEAPPGLIAQADYTVEGVNGVERFLRWLAEEVCE